MVEFDDNYFDYGLQADWLKKHLEEEKKQSIEKSVEKESKNSQNLLKPKKQRSIPLCLIPLVFPAAVIIGFIALNFYKYHNVTYKQGNKTYASKIDGLFSHTSINIDKDELCSVSRITPSANVYYCDVDGDLKVDEINKVTPFFSRGPVCIYLKRQRDLESYIKEFNKADKDFQEQVERFRDYIPAKKH